MRIICYRKPPCSEQEARILDRAAHKKHLLKKLILWDLLLFITLAFLGPLLHYAGALSPTVPLLQFIAPINESPWEHLKLLFFPAVLIGIVRRLCTGKLQHGILTTFAEGLLLSMLLMIVLFYTYSGILGMHILIVDIALFYICSLVLTLYVHFRSYGQKNSSLPGLIILLLLAGCFFYFTLYPPNIAIFYDLNQSLQ